MPPRRAAWSRLIMPAAREFAQFGVRVLAIAPGHLRHADAGAPAAAGAGVPRRLGAVPQVAGRAAQFAALVLHIIHNPYLNGEVIRLDGALRMAPR